MPRSGDCGQAACIEKRSWLGSSLFDDFEGDTLDLTKWSCGYPWGATHNHRAYMSPDNVLVEDGLLRIKAENKRHPDAPKTIVHGGETFSLDYTSVW